MLWWWEPNGSECQIFQKKKSIEVACVRALPVDRARVLYGCLPDLRNRGHPGEVALEVALVDIRSARTTAGGTTENRGDERGCEQN